MPSLVNNPAQDLDWLDMAEQQPYGQMPQNGQAFSTPQQQIGQSAINQAANPMLSQEHYGAPNAQGLVPINASGFKHLNDNMPARPTIADNSDMISPTPSAGIPQGGNNNIIPLQKGLIGGIVDNYISTVTGGILGNASKKIQQNSTNNSQQSQQLINKPTFGSSDEWYNQQ